MWSIVRVCCLLFLCLSVACTPEPEAAPSQLVGVWETQAAGYADQHMFIDHHRIRFGASAVDADGYVITQISESQEGSKTLFVVAYQDADQARYQLAFYYDPASGGRITFKNQDHLIWTRKESAS